MGDSFKILYAVLKKEKEIKNVFPFMLNKVLGKFIIPLNYWSVIQLKKVTYFENIMNTLHFIL